MQKSPKRQDPWQLWSEHAADALYLDIETNGLGSWAKITLLGTYFRGQYRAFVNGVDLDDAWDYIHQAPLLVTFNGKQFDVPFIQRHFGMTLELPHIDLRWVAASLGYKGGLKRIEPEFGIERSAAVKAVDGYEAVALWKRHTRGDREALRLLVDYNQADVEGLPLIMKGCVEKQASGIRN